MFFPGESLLYSISVAISETVPKVQYLNSTAQALTVCMPVLIADKSVDRTADKVM